MCKPFKRKRSNNYWFRRRIPDELRPLYKDKKEIHRSLKTPDLREAKKRAHEEWLILEQEFEVKRQALAARSSSEHQRDALFDFLASPNTEAPAVVVTQAEIDAAELSMHESADYFAQEEFALEVIEGQLREEAYHAQLRTKVLSRLQAEAGARGEAFLLAPVVGVRAEAVAPQRVCTSFDAAIEQWAAERRPTPRTVHRTKNIFARFKAAADVESIEKTTKQHAIAFKNHLTQEGSNPTNTNTMLSMLSAVFNYAVAQAVIAVNPIAGVSVADPRRAKEKRLPFDEAALCEIFNGPVYSNAERPVAGAGEAAYWLPLLALYTGARLEEIGQLSPNDVHQEGDVWVIRFSDRGDGQELKNDGSARRIPLHADLIRLGFIAFTKSSKGRARIFHELKPANDGKETGNWSKWFNGRYLRVTCGVTDKRYVFHSFRHCFKHYARQAQIAEDVHDALSGHSSESVARSYGGLDYPLAPLVDAMARYAVPAKVRSIIMRGL